MRASRSEAGMRIMDNWSRHARAAALAALGALALAGCSKLGGPLVEVPPPDEFAVMRYEPPVIPAHLDQLPPPRPGTPSPREPDPDRLVAEALGGPVGGAAVETRAPSPGEQELLSSAKATTASSEIRYQLTAEQEAESGNKPYEPPLIWELFSGRKGKKKVPKGEVIEPLSEAQRLLAEGRPAPYDPELAARLAAEKAPPPPPAKPYYQPGRPENRLPASGTSTAY